MDQRIGTGGPGHEEIDQKTMTQEPGYKKQDQVQEPGLEDHGTRCGSRDWDRRTWIRGSG